MSTTGALANPTGPAQAFGLVLEAVVGTVAGKLERAAAGWIGKLTDRGLDAVADSGGAAQRAGAEGIKAQLHGDNPAWAAIRGAWQTGSPAVRAAIITSAAAAVVLLLVSPALLVVYLLSWLVVAAAHRRRTSRPQ